jgi:tRNA-Thr(GGU) m(6)t(6)A37 methyltransferase TsaA
MYGTLWSDVTFEAGGAVMSEPESFTLIPIGIVRSNLRDLSDAPRQGFEGAPDAWIELKPGIVDALRGVEAGDDLVVITWFHLADRDTLQVHPRDDLTRPPKGVFATRSPDRLNPLGLHRVSVREVQGAMLKVGPLEAIDSTPVVDIKVALTESQDA